MFCMKLPNFDHLPDIDWTLYLYIHIWPSYFTTSYFYPLDSIGALEAYVIPVPCTRVGHP
jgi:hypothetical protein